MTLAKMIAKRQAALAVLAQTRAGQDAVLVELRSKVESADAGVTPADVNAAITARGETDAAIRALNAEIEALRTEGATDVEMRAMLERVAPTAARDLPRAYDQVIRTSDTAEQRTYSPSTERSFDTRTGQLRAGARPGATFERDVIAAHLGDFDAMQRLARHRQEEQVERGRDYPELMTRAVGTGAFAGLTVPQYLTDFWAPATAAMRPFADVCTHHDLPPSGMTLDISRITTASSVTNQANENAASSETNMDDTMLSVAVLTASGQQTISRQAIDRSTGVEPIVMNDLFRRYATNLDSNLINLAATGMTNIATNIAYTDATPTVAEFLPLVSQAASNIETAMLDLGSGEIIALMHGRRWYWLNQALSTSHPLINQPGAQTNAAGVNYATAYGRGFRGVLPNSIPVVADNNCAINLGVGAEDEVYFFDRSEVHLWEDPAAPMFIRAEQPAAAALGVLLVVYGYYAFTHARVPHVQKISGTGLTTPGWTGV